MRNQLSNMTCLHPRGNACTSKAIQREMYFTLFIAMPKSTSGQDMLWGPQLKYNKVFNLW